MPLIKKRNTLFILFLAIILVSCTQHRYKNIPVTNAKRDSYVDKITVNGVIESTNSFNITCPRLRLDVTVIYLIPEGTYVKKGDTVCILDSPELENSYAESIKNLETSKSEYSKTKAELDLQYTILMSQVHTIEATTSISRLDSSQLNFASPVRKKLIELQLQQAEIERDKILNQLEFLKKINSAELQKMKLRIKQEEKRVERAKSKLDQLVQITQIDGIAVRGKVRWRRDKIKEGDIVWDNMPLVQIPNTSKMQVNLTVDEGTYKRIEKKQKVDIKVDAMPGTYMTGTVKYKEPVGKPIERDSKVKEFGISIAIDSLIPGIKPGIGATCDIYINNISDTLIIPYISVFEDDSLQVVYVSNHKYFEKRPVELVINNNNIAIVKSGVYENELISLIKPPESLIKN